MPFSQLSRRSIERIWGRLSIPPAFGVAATTDPIGEIWFTDDAGRDAELLVKYIFTSERLSIQVHPDDAAAKARGYARGKDEAWYILDAEPGAVIGLGLTETISPETLRAAALDGGIEELIDWRPAKAGDLFWSPAGTVHAIGGGLSLIEVQQNLDLTYRLYDYGRPRELHVEQGIEAAHRRPYDSDVESVRVDEGRTALLPGPIFVLERWTGARAQRLAASADRPVWFIPVSGDSSLNGKPIAPGTCWLADESVEISVGTGGDLLAAYPGAEILTE